MAQLNSRGTLTRSRWDYFEHSNGVSSCFGSVTSGAIGCYFANNSSGATAIDIYTLNWNVSVAGPFALYLLLPPLVLTPLAPTESHIFALAPDVATPPGLNGMFTAIGGISQNYLYYTSGTVGDEVSPITGSYFATLPPGWAIAMFGQGSANPIAMSMTVWYQYVTDNIAPAP